MKRGSTRGQRRTVVVLLSLVTSPLFVAILLAGVGIAPTPAAHSLAPSTHFAGGTTILQSLESPLGGFPYPVTFSETGLPNGTTWSVALNGTTRSSTGPAIQFTEVNGNYSFTIGTVSGYSANPPSGSVTVSGGPVSRTIAFSPASSSPSGSSTNTFLGLPVWEATALIAIPVVVGVLLLLGFFGCPDKCKPKGAKKGCSSSITLETFPCGQGPGSTKDIETGAEIMALGAKLTGKLEVFGETYGKMLEAMPGWIKAAGTLTGQKVGVEVFATVNCRWEVCAYTPCWFFSKQPDWTTDWRFWGPYKLSPPSGYAKSSAAECFGPGLSAEELTQAIGAALGANAKVAEARKNCTKVCE